MKTPEEIKKGLEYCKEQPAECWDCPYDLNDGADCSGSPLEDALALINQLQEDKKQLQEIICNQRRQLRVLHAMYEWALSRLQKAKINDRAHFQAWLRKRGYDLKTMELPESKYQQLEAERDQYKRERDAAVADIKQIIQDPFGVSCCDFCKFGDNEEECEKRNCRGNRADFEWRGLEVE